MLHSSETQHVLHLYKYNFLFKHVINEIRFSLKAYHTVWQYITPPGPDIDMLHFNTIITSVNKLVSSHYFSSTCYILFKFWTMFLNPYWSEMIFLHHIWTQELTNMCNRSSLPIKPLYGWCHQFRASCWLPRGSYHNFPSIPLTAVLYPEHELAWAVANISTLNSEQNQHITKYYRKPWSWQVLVKLVMHFWVSQMVENILTCWAIIISPRTCCME